jgi:hypothetical protein
VCCSGCKRRLGWLFFEHNSVGVGNAVGIVRIRTLIEGQADSTHVGDLFDGARTVEIATGSAIYANPVIATMVSEVMGVLSIAQAGWHNQLCGTHLRSKDGISFRNGYGLRHRVDGLDSGADAGLIPNSAYMSGGKSA